MKKGIFYLLFLFLAATSFAQTKTGSAHSKIRGIIKLYPLQALVGELRFGFEKPIAKRFSLEVSPGLVFFLHNGEIDGDLYGLDARGGMTGGIGFAARASVMYYLSKKNNQDGLFISPLFLYKYFYGKTNFDKYPPLTQDIIMYGAQLLVGYKFKVADFIIEPYSGFGYKHVSYNYDFNNMTPIDSYTSQYPTFQLGVAIGYIKNKKIK